MEKKKIDAREKNLSILPLLSFNNTVITPLIPQPLKIDTEEQKEFLDKCIVSNSEVFVGYSHRSDEENKKEEQVMEYGVVCIIDRVMQMPGGPTLAFVRPIYRAKFHGVVFSPSFPMAKVSRLKEIPSPKKLDMEVNLTLERIEALFHQLMHYIPDQERETAEKVISDNTISEVQRLYAISHVAPISSDEKYQILKCSTFKTLLQTVALVLDQAKQRIELQALIHERTHHEITQQQKENFLRIHLKQIKDELGENYEADDISDLLAKANTKVWKPGAEAHFDKELKKLKRLNINNPEYSIQYSYLETFLDLPWDNFSNADISLNKVEEILNRDHFGLEKVKERILEYIAVVKLRRDLKAPIICLYGPPGVGKTSIGKSVAEAVGRDYKRISLGGLHDEAEIRGHRRTYIGAMPGRFVDAISKCTFGDPLILLDEIDKVGKDYKGDPSSALLEALDPEQNNTFHDNFIDYPYDLSRVMFIATANDLSTIPAPLRDRMEIIEMPGYTLEEKREIALRHLIGQALSENGFDPDDLKFSPEAIDTIIRSFTHEKGVRQLKMQISKIIRKLALQKVRGNSIPDLITREMINNYLDKKETYHTSLGFRG